MINSIRAKLLSFKQDRIIFLWFENNIVNTKYKCQTKVMLFSFNINFSLSPQDYK